MQDLYANPFQELYLTEALEDPELYLSWFSPTVLTGDADALFRVGNIVLSGANGAGKTMLLRLFSPDVQAAYLRLHPKGGDQAVSRRVLGIGINFVHAGFSSLGSRTLNKDAHEDLQVWSLLLGDLINYYLIEQLIKALKFLQTDKGQPLAKFLEASVKNDKLDEFARHLATLGCWFGYLDGVGSLDDLTSLVQRRLRCIRSFVNWNSDRLPSDILKTKTVIGEPLTQARRVIDDLRVLPKDVPLSVTIDQYETLLHIDYGNTSERSVGRSFCRVVNTFLSRRDPSVSYKIGVRPYSWGRELRIFGSDATLELGRDYQNINLDEILRRQENRSAWIFPDFAGDVAARRLGAALKGNVSNYRNWLQETLESLEANDEIQKYTRNRKKPLVPRLGKWPPKWRQALQRKYEADPFSALLMEVWMLQEIDRSGALPDPPDDDAKAPWNREYWRKERKNALLTQIASACSQRKLYAGWQTLLTLSGGNILVFLSLCREMWDLSQRSDANGRKDGMKFSAELQSQAVWSVATSWVRKQEEFPGGAERRRFITRLGIAMRKSLVADKKLSYPGHIGFSLTEEELKSPRGSRVEGFLDSAADYGALLKARHTTKERDRKPRFKWYLFPVLSPYFDIPIARTKEPYYATVEDVESWLSSNEPIQFARKRRDRGRQTNLFQ